MFANTFLAAFYGIEMAGAMGWSTEQRYMQLKQARIMIVSGES